MVTNESALRRCRLVGGAGNGIVFGMFRGTPLRRFERSDEYCSLFGIEPEMSHQGAVVVPVVAQVPPVVTLVGKRGLAFPSQRASVGAYQPFELGGGGVAGDHRQIGLSGRVGDPRERTDLRVAQLPFGERLGDGW
jgi:hypothetical protein